MKAILEFTLPADNEEYRQARQGMGFYRAAETFRSELRNELKYKNLSYAERVCIERLRDVFLTTFADLLD